MVLDADEHGGILELEIGTVEEWERRPDGLNIVNKYPLPLGAVLLITPKRLAFVHSTERSDASDKRWDTFDRAMDKLDHVTSPVAWLRDKVQDKVEDKVMGKLGYEEDDPRDRTTVLVGAEIDYWAIHTVGMKTGSSVLKVVEFRVVTSGAAADGRTPELRGLDFGLTSKGTRRLPNFLQELHQRVVAAKELHVDAMSEEDRAQLAANSTWPAPDLTPRGKWHVFKVHPSWTLGSAPPSPAYDESVRPKPPPKAASVAPKDEEPDPTVARLLQRGEISLTGGVLFDDGWHPDLAPLVEAEPEVRRARDTAHLQERGGHRRIRDSRGHGLAQRVCL